jgi:hypothetical protein
MYGGSWTGDGIYCKMGRDGDGGDGNLKGWESARAWVGDGKSSVSSCQAESARAVSNVPQGVGAPDPRPRRSGRHRVASASIGLENVPTLFGGRQCEAILASSPQKAIGGSPVEMLSCY